MTEWKHIGCGGRCSKCYGGRPDAWYCDGCEKFVQVGEVFTIHDLALLEVSTDPPEHLAARNIGFGLALAAAAALGRWVERCRARERRDDTDEPYTLAAAARDVFGEAWR